MYLEVIFQPWFPATNVTRAHHWLGSGILVCCLPLYRLHYQSLYCYLTPNTKVVLTVVSGILFARFLTVECISKSCSFFYDVLVVQKSSSRNRKFTSRGGASVCWRRLHNVLVTKCIKSGGKSQFSLSFLPSTVNDARRKLYMVGIYSTVEK